MYHADVLNDVVELQTTQNGVGFQGAKVIYRARRFSSRPPPEMSPVNCFRGFSYYLGTNLAIGAIFETGETSWEAPRLVF